jgi:hypothetical protein
MSRRKGELTTSQLHRDWPHHVALPAEKVRGLANSETVRGFAKTLSVAPLTYYVRRTDEAHFVIFCFKTPEDAQVFAERFGGERLAVRAVAASADDYASGGPLPGVLITIHTIMSQALRMAAYSSINTAAAIRSALTAA